MEAFNMGERVEGGIRTAVEAWCEDPVAATQLYGPIASWNVSQVTLAPRDIPRSPRVHTGFPLTPRQTPSPLPGHQHGFPLLQRSRV